ncbi:MAG: 23S rRNA pseudouridine(1911/1915/1917) synthase RluD [Xanthomonadales bacterium]|nr:23S rRNA pseudouridine(1911/1915/1917) synthase RluD [Xanthomonadales bacterium]
MPETDLQSDQRIQQSARAAPDHAGMRLDQAAAELFGDFSRARLQKWIRAGDLTVDGRVQKPTYRLEGGEMLALEAEPEFSEEVRPEAIPLNLLYADDDLVVLDKPARLVVHPAAGNPDGTLQNALLHFDPKLAALPRAGIVHRLDKDTSGVIVVARSLRAHASLVEQLQSRDMTRRYRAVVLGEMIAGGTVDAPIGRHPTDRKRMAVVRPESRSGRPAVSRYRVVERFVGLTQVSVALETGRTHQIRVHMAHIGHPLVGDPVYGRGGRRRRGMSEELVQVLRAFPRQALHAEVLELVHPGSGERVRFEAPLPADYEVLLDDLRRLAK